MSSFVIDTPLFVQTCNVEIYVRTEIHEILSFDKVWKRMIDEIYRFRLAPKLIRWVFHRDKECK